MKNALLLIIICFFIRSNDVYSQQLIKQFTVDDGLPSVEIYFVHQSHDGYIWFCTDRGVSRYNGYEFENFTSNDGITYNTVFKVFEDPEHNLWFTCYDGSLSIWDFKLKKFRAFEKNKQLITLFGSANWAQELHFSNDCLWIFSYRPILNKPAAICYNLKSKCFMDDDVPIAENFSQSFNRTEHSGRYVHSTGDLETVQKPISVYLKDVSAEKFRSKSGVKNELNTLLKKYHPAIIETADNVENITFYKDLLFITGRNGLAIYKNGIPVAHSLPIIAYSGIEIDFEGNIWLAGIGGVYVLTQLEIDTYDLSDLFKTAEKSTAISVFNDLLYVGTSAGHVYDVHNKQLVTTLTGNGRVHFFSKMNNDLIVLLNPSLGFSIAKKKTFHPAKFFSTNNPYLVLNINSEVNFALSPGESCFFKNGKLIAKIDKHVRHACLGKKNELYYSTHDELYLVNVQNMKNPLRLTKKYHLEGQTVRRIYHDAKGFLVLATVGDGLTLVKNGQFLRQLTTKDGLPSNSVNASYLDHENRRLWIATNRGICLISYLFSNNQFKIRSVYTINKMSGIPSDYIEEITYSQDSIYFALLESVISLSKKLKTPKIDPPKLIFTALKNDGRNYLGQNPQFRYFENDLQIEFVANALNKSSNSKYYRYRLIQNGDKSTTWTFTNDRTISFKNLSHGEYTFEISAKSTNSAWGAPTQLTFSISPFWLNRWSVRLILFLVASILTFLLIRNRIRKIKKLSAKEMRLKDLQLTNNQLEMASLRGQMNPHFIFNVLSSIQKNVLIGEKWQANILLTRFSKLIRSSLEYSRNEFITLEKEITFLENYLEIEKQRTPHKFNYSIDVQLPDNLDDVFIPALLIQPICENAIKHAFEKSNGNLTISIKPKNEFLLEICVMDDGIGYVHSPKKDNPLQHSRGMEIVKARLLLFKEQGLNAELTIESLDQVSSSGTVVILNIPWK